MNKTTRHIIWFCFFFIITQNFSHASEPSNNVGTVRFQQGKLSIDAQAIPLGEILEAIYQKAGVDISGLENRKDEQITFSSAGETEEILRRLLRHLKEDNYAFEFSDVRLLKISVVANSGRRRVASAPVQRNQRRQNQEKLVRAIKVRGIVEGTQASSLGLMEGDYIIEYDGKKVSQSQQLVREVKKKSETDDVEMIIVRDGVSMPFMLKGGLIGVNITTTRVPKEELGMRN